MRDASLPTACFQGVELDKDDLWHYWNDCKAVARGRIAQLYNSTDAPKHWAEDKICRGHADLFYVQQHAFKTYARFSKYFEYVNLEVAVQTVLNMVVAELESDYVPTNCAGNCCGDIDTAHLDEMNCGHKFNFINETVREDVARFLHRGVPKL